MARSAASAAKAITKITTRCRAWLGRLDRLRRLAGQLRQVAGQSGKVVQGHRGEGRGAAVVELLQIEPASGKVPLQRLQDDVPVVVRRAQRWLRHGVSVLGTQFSGSSTAQT